MRGFAAAWDKAEAQSACASIGGEAGLRPGPVVLAPELCSHRGAQVAVPLGQRGPSFS